MFDSLISKIKDKDKVALSKCITIVENKLSGYQEILSKLYSKRKEIQKIGITGPPGAGKSTLTNKLCERYVRKNKKVGIVCVDPSSPFNGGAILGDRIRMRDIDMSDNVFIRSLATRGSYGGLSKSISDLELLYEAFGFDLIIYETVGVGQIELDVINYCDTVILLITPESGDDIQIMKAGLIECADIIGINKSDRLGADKLNTFLEQYLRIGSSEKIFQIVKLIATEGTGVKALSSCIDDHYKNLLKNKTILKKHNKRYKDSVLSIASNFLLKDFLNDKRSKLIDQEILKDTNSRLSPYDLFSKIK